jgi:MFS transporter, MFS domain-containing protein family, molybdate-anion transporter
MTTTVSFASSAVDKGMYRNLLMGVKNLLLPGWMPLSYPSFSSGELFIQQREEPTSPAWLFLYVQKDPDTLFHTLLVSLVSVTVLVRLLQMKAPNKPASSDASTASTSTTTTKSRMSYAFLAVFFCLRMSFWMSGPYFYAAYACKTVAGKPVTDQLISYISLVGFSSIAAFGPLMGKWVDQYGRKLGTLVACVLYGLGCLSTTSHTPWMWYAGRALGGLGTSLLSAAPEAWLVSELSGGQGLKQTFTTAYAYDPVVAIAAGQLAGWAAKRGGPTGPFQLSPIFLLTGGLLAALLWKENKAMVKNISSPTPQSSDEQSDEQSDDNGTSGEESDTKHPPTIADALQVLLQNKKIALLGSVQALFEGAMYIFVLQWPPMFHNAIHQAYGTTATIPYGTAFSCFMASCMAGSTMFGILNKRNNNTTNATNAAQLERQSILLLAVATLALLLAACCDTQLPQLIAAFFVFEACVGMYFPSIGTLRSTYLPDSHRGVLMTLFGVPLNIIVVTVFLLVPRLGARGAMLVATLCLALATACMTVLYKGVLRKKVLTLDRFRNLVRKVQIMKDISEELQRAAERQNELSVREIVQENRDTYSTLSGPRYF